MSNPADYTVGWICAIEKELVAAQVFLDEKHSTPDHVPVNDNNTYVLGRVGKHNVVVTAMPHQQYGLVSAAIVARDMVRSFPNVRIGLMVGIGGGAPSPKHDIRLGDIVVSSPGYGNGGVFQYDYGKTIQDQSFTTTGYLNQPPLFMLTALSALNAEYETDGHNIDATIQTVLEKKPRLRSKYCRPDLSTDTLYESHWKHAGKGEDDCKTVCSSGNLISRPERSDDEDNPTIHYGLIASANQLMKDALIRDKLSAEKDVLCFEMEAAGLMNHFPCLVVRGICDYSDTHKNSLWQGYAAMTAAAYARDLLHKITPNKVEAERRLGEMLLDVQEDVKRVEAGVESLRADVHFDHIRGWLLPPDPSTNLNIALKNRHLGSGQWLLQLPVYSTWQSERNSFLWLYGIPGCGKTILSSTIIEDLTKKGTSHGLLYFYFDFNDSSKQNFDMMLRSLINQLYNKSKDVRSSLDSLYSSCSQGRQQPSLESLSASFRDMVELAGEVWIVIDAVDECTTRDGYPVGGLLPWIQSLQDYQANIHLLLTSRPEQDIEAAIKDRNRDRDIIIPIQNDSVKEDINAYVYARVREHGELSRRWHSRQKIQSDIETTLIKKADGMFRWVSCQLDELEKCLGPQEVRQALANLPRTLDETYARIVANIPSEHKRFAIRILQFLTFSERPLSLDEAVDAIAVDTSTQRFDPENSIPVPTEISRYCSSLVVIVERAGGYKKTTTRKSIQLAHFSVKEYLVSSRLEHSIARDFEMTSARASLANVCLAYLLGLEYNRPVEEVCQLYPLTVYATEYWTSHAAAANSSTFLIRNLMADFFDSKKAFEACYQLHPLDFQWMKGEELEAPPALYYAAFAGLSQVVQMLLNKGNNANSQGGYYGHALQAASCEGHEKIVQILLDHGADINAQGGEFNSALQAASYIGHERIIQMLLDQGANINAQGGSSSNALQAASYTGHEKIIQILLDQGADINAQSGYYGNALQAASYEGHEKIVQVLLDRGANVNAQSGSYGNALQAASCEGYEKIVQVLLDQGADINAQSGYYGNALQAASCVGYENIVQVLLDQGADINAQGGHHGNALQAASYEGHEKIVKMLLDRGADIEIANKGGRKPLHAASRYGHLEIAKLLCERGADVNVASKNGWTPLHTASSNGQAEVVKLLLIQDCHYLGQLVRGIKIR
ncbi:ankyrin repeat-containing domain protein [Xylariaceae sp. AK1471]|nr:ankyrin repeat-containing domain protein [Xylariaceae sp. AK1471]